MVAIVFVVVLLLVMWSSAIELFRENEVCMATLTRLRMPARFHYVAATARTVLGLGLMVAIMIGNPRGALVAVTAGLIVLYSAVALVGHLRVRDDWRQVAPTLGTLLGSAILLAVTV